MSAGTPTGVYACGCGGAPPLGMSCPEPLPYCSCGCLALGECQPDEPDNVAVPRTYLAAWRRDLSALMDQTNDRGVRAAILDLHGQIGFWEQQRPDAYILDAGSGS